MINAHTAQSLLPENRSDFRVLLRSGMTIELECLVEIVDPLLTDLDESYKAFTNEILEETEAPKFDLENERNFANLVFNKNAFNAYPPKTEEEYNQQMENTQELEKAEKEFEDKFYGFSKPDEEKITQKINRVKIALKSRD